MVVGLLVSITTLVLLAGLAHDFLRLRLIPGLTRPGSNDDQPMVSVLIPARNEARNISRCLDGVLGQTYQAYEVIVVDDGSTDATPTLLASYAQRDERLKVITGAALPVGWTGKCNACQQAADAAQGDWLLFLDADTVPQPELLASLVAYAQPRELDLLTVFPFLELRSFWERVVLPPFQSLIYMVFPVERLNAVDARPDEIVANGQCMLVRRSAYDAVGGHTAVYGEVLEDVRFAQTLRAAGFRVAAAEGRRYLRVRMYTSGHEVREGLMKHAESGYRSGGGRSFWAGARQIALTFGPLDLFVAGVVLLLTRGDVFAWAVALHGAVVVVVAFSFWGWFLRQHYGLSQIYALLWPFGVLCYTIIALRGMWRVRSGRGVIWKGRTYVGK